MKQLLVVTVATGILAGLATYNMSGRQPQQHPEADRTIQPPIPFAPRSPPPLPGTLVTTRSAQKVPIAKHLPLAVAKSWHGSSASRSSEHCCQSMMLGDTAPIGSSYPR